MKNINEKIESSNNFSDNSAETHSLAPNRIGCIGLFLKDKKEIIEDYKNNPEHYKAYIKAFDGFISRQSGKGLFSQFKDGQEAFDWWLNL